MLVKILGIFDLIAALLILALSFRLAIPQGIIIFFIIVLLAKGAFILTKSIASGLDLFAALVLILSLFYTLPYALFFIAAILLLQKGILSLM
ncbi:MAG TPA: hypothetical protein VMZ91_02510 [Candidatus Paceibacterota bacterium]|nr:hypothetical protein [Candidatus Paceibacterota bacterium]